MKHRSEHRKLDARGACRRCGLGTYRGPCCPPGFWMTKAEIDVWLTASAAERTDMERRLGAAR